MEWYRLLSQELTSKAYTAANGELAWFRNDAVLVIKTLEENKYAITGIDVWAPSDTGPVISGRFVYDWKLRSAPREDLHPSSPHEFIKTFQWDRTEHESLRATEPVFNIWADKTALL